MRGRGMRVARARDDGECALGSAPGPCSSIVAVEAPGAGMTDDGRARFRERTGTDLAERGAQFVDVKIDEMGGTLLAQRADGPEKGFPGEGGIGTERKGAHHVLARTNAAVEHHRGLAADRRDDRRQDIDRGRQGLDLPAAVVRNPYPLDAERNRFLDRKSTRLNSSHVAISY